MQQESAQESHGSFPIVIATISPTAGQRRVTLTVIALLLIGIVASMPFADVQAGRVDAFIPVLQTVMCFADLITASLLFAQFSIQPQHAILVLASGYICSGLFAFLQTLSFPGGYAPAGLIGDGIDTPAWLFVLWNTTFEVGVIVYALWKRVDGSADVPGRLVGSTIAATIACVLVVVALLTWIVTAWVDHLPSMYTGGVTQQTFAAHAVNAFIWVISVAALAALLVRRRSILDLWLIVTLIAWMPNFIVGAIFDVVRFSVGWYLARGYALIASCTVLIVLLTETTVLYARLVTALALLRREHANRLMSVDAATAAMAHEVRQPLTGISTNGSAALKWLAKTPPDLERARASVEAMVEAGRRGDKVISSIRGLIKRSTDERAEIGINDLARQVLSLLAHDLRAQEVAVTAQYQDDLPEIRADRTLLQQVLLNLVRNAIDAMARVEPRARLLSLTTRLNGNSSVVISVEDSGRGVPSEHQARLFEPFFTSKPTGMGLGLSICRTIVEDHGGALRLVKTDSRGSTFEIDLPVG